jgi:hypothetical protein
MSRFDCPGKVASPGTGAMDENLAVSLGVLALLLWTWGYALAALHWYVRPALQTGILQARGRAYSRVEQPGRFWLGIGAWIALAVLLAAPAILFALQLWRRFLT